MPITNISFHVVRDGEAGAWLIEHRWQLGDVKYKDILEGSFPTEVEAAIEAERLNDSRR